MFNKYSVFIILSFSLSYTHVLFHHTDGLITITVYILFDTKFLTSSYKALIEELLRYFV